MIEHIRNGHAKAQRFNRAVAPILGVGAAASIFISSYQMEGIRTEIRDRSAQTEARLARIEERMDRLTDRRAETEPPASRIAAK